MGARVLPPLRGGLAGYGLVVALPAEARAFGHHGRARDAPVALAGGHWLRVSGVGDERAAAAARELAVRPVAGLVSFGTCGALAPGLAPGALVYPREVVTCEGERWATADIPLGPGILREGRLVSVARPVCTVTEKAGLHKTLGAWAVDMESAAVARVAYAQGLAFIAVRVVVDPSDEGLPEALLASVDAWGRPRPEMLAALVTSPTQWRQLWRLRRQFRSAQKRLQTVAGWLIRPET